MNNMFSKKNLVLLSVGIFLFFAVCVLFIIPLGGKNSNIIPSPTPRPIKTITPQPTQENQGELDFQYNQALVNFYQTHPWYNKIPPKNNDFFIGFNASTNSFFVELYPKANLSQKQDEQVTQLKNAVLGELKTI
jgi:hypothetical protein